MLLSTFAFLIQNITPAKFKTKGSVCDVKAYSKTGITFPKEVTTTAQKIGYLAKKLALAEDNLVKKTTYTYNVSIDGKAGLFYSDCSCFVGYVVNHVSEDHLAEIPLDKCVKPAAARANMWSGYFNSGDASKGKSKHWKSIKTPKDALEGDVISWGFKVDSKCKIVGGHNDTGHVMVITKGPKGEDAVSVKDSWATIWVSDASNIRHLPGSDKGARYSALSVENKENPGKTAGGPKNTGIGMGQIKIALDKDGVPTGKFILQKKEVDGAEVGIGRPL